MTIKIGRDQLEAWFGPENGKYSKQERFAFARKLRDLAPWWLAPEELTFLDSVARELGTPSFADRPCLPDKPGCCWVLALVEPHENLPRLRPAVVLPLRWQKDRGSHDPRLPASLTYLADQVALQLATFLQRSSQAGSVKWTLHFAVENAPDLSRLPIGEESAWGSLAGGLILAVEGIGPRQKVWATVAGDDSDIRAVELGPEGEKLQTACAFGATTVFVPYQTDVRAKELQGSHPDLNSVEIKPLFGSTSGRGSVETLLRPYLSALRQEPSDSDEFEVRKRYYLNLEGRNPARTWFYKHLLLDVVDRARKGDTWSRLSAINDLVVIASMGMENIPVLCGVFQPQRLWVWYDGTFLEKMLGKGAGEEDLQKEIDLSLIGLKLDRRPQVQPLLLADSNHENLARIFRQFFDNEVKDDGSSWMIDVTLGTSLMSVCLYEAAKHGVPVAYVHNQTDPGTDRKFFERIECWRKP